MFAPATGQAGTPVPQVRRFALPARARPPAPWRGGSCHHEGTHHTTVPLEDNMAIESIGNSVTVKINPATETSPEGLLANAELHFHDGPLAGLKLVGFTIWAGRHGRRTITFPARHYNTNRTRRSFTLLRDLAGHDASDALRRLILEAYAAAVTPPPDITD